MDRSPTMAHNGTSGHGDQQKSSISIGNFAACDVNFFSFLLDTAAKGFSPVVVVVAPLPAFKQSHEGQHQRGAIEVAAWLTVERYDKAQECYSVTDMDSDTLFTVSSHDLPTHTRPIDDILREIYGRHLVQRAAVDGVSNFSAFGVTLCTLIMECKQRNRQCRLVVVAPISVLVRGSSSLLELEPGEEIMIEKFEETYAQFLIAKSSAKSIGLLTDAVALGMYTRPADTLLAGLLSATNAPQALARPTTGAPSAKRKVTDTASQEEARRRGRQIAQLSQEARKADAHLTAMLNNDPIYIPQLNFEENAGPVYTSWGIPFDYRSVGDEM